MTLFATDPRRRGATSSTRAHAWTWMLYLLLAGLAIWSVSINANLSQRSSCNDWPAEMVSTVPSKRISETKNGATGPKKHLVEQDAERIAEKWDHANENFATGGAWHQHPLVISTFQHRLEAGSPSWPLHIKEKYGFRKKCLSIGCGDGRIESSFVTMDVCGFMRGIDLSPVRIQRANDGVPPELKDRLQYFVENAETDTLATSANEYDLVLFTHALHHIMDLESMAQTVKKLLADDGILVLQEYIGAPRYQFPDDQRKKMAQFLIHIEKEHPSFVPVLRQNPLWDGTTMGKPDAKAVELDDPSESVRSNEIVSVLGQMLHLVEDVPIGGTFFQWIFHNAYNALNDDGEGTAIVQEMLDEEMRLIKNNELHSDYVFQVWKKK